MGTTNPKASDAEMENQMNRTIDTSGRNATIPFAGVDIPVAYKQGKPWIVLRYVMNDLGLEPGSAWQLLKEKAWAESCLTHAYDTRGYFGEMRVVSPTTFLIWLSRLTYVPTQARERLSQYQVDVYKSFASHAKQVFPERKLP